MGGSQSKNSNNLEKHFDNFYEVIDFIASKYITTMNFQSLKSLSDKQYCDDLVILTSDIINKNFNYLDVVYLEQRTKKGIIINDTKKENIVFLSKRQLEKLDVSNDKNKSIHKKRMCMGIAKFYVKIAHIFSAIITTVNPIYTFKNDENQNTDVPLSEKHTIPINTKRKITKINICDNRIRSLNFENIQDDKSNVNIHPKICSIHKKKDSDEYKSLHDEPGIPELEQLYFDDEYDYSTGKFIGMNSKTKKQYEKDVKLFYNVFTGKKEIPDNIKSFKDIKLTMFEKDCNDETNKYLSPYTISTNELLFIKYADNIKNMIKNASYNQNKLLDVVNDLFVIEYDGYTKNKRIRVKKNLTDEKLSNLVKKTRNIIIELYISCEKHYIEGIKLYQAIVDTKIINTVKNQLITLEKEKEENNDSTEYNEEYKTIENIKN